MIFAERCIRASNYCLQLLISTDCWAVAYCIVFARTSCISVLNVWRTAAMLWLSASYWWATAWPSWAVPTAAVLAAFADCWTMYASSPSLLLIYCCSCSYCSRSVAAWARCSSILIDCFLMVFFPTWFLRCMAQFEILEGAFWEYPRFFPIALNLSGMLEGPVVAKYWEVLPDITVTIRGAGLQLTKGCTGI